MDFTAAIQRPPRGSHDGRVATEAAGGVAWRAMWAIVTLAGLALVAYMVSTEGEPGALPLALILVGTIGFAATWRNRRGV